MKKIVFKSLALIGILLLLCFITHQVCAESNPEFYIFGCGDFLDHSHREKIIKTLIKKYPLENQEDGFRLAHIPSLVGKKYFSPSPNEKLWTCYGSEILGTTKIKDYIWGGNGYQSDHISFEVFNMFGIETEGEEHLSDDEQHSILFITVPPGTVQNDEPKGYSSASISEEEEKKIVLQLNPDDSNDTEAFTATATFIPTNTVLPVATFTPTFTPTETPTLTYVQKVENYAKTILANSAELKPTPTSSYDMKTVSIPIELGLPPVNTPTWEEKSKSVEIIHSFDFSEEGVKFLELTWPWDPSREKFIYVINGHIYGMKTLFGNVVLGGTTVIVDQTFRVMGKKYIVLSVDTGMSDELYIYRIEKGKIVEVKSGGLAYD